MVVTGAWWDLVDGVAHVFGALLRKYQKEIRPVLRQYAWTDPKEVARFVAAHGSRLSGLSRREALKNI